ncbi:WD40 repeat-like protein [Massarina eburnea CBS 473.64]|uniref:WD40 repeat-like protein n=1 Tax=Massarina eburnea CBS 473.64 TaxID=1395130 RepID=A0A6A6RXR0_9PLEO|nr:WD40 repeat-like protein [Massarina eburnea CBS 473.64]
MAPQQRARSLPKSSFSAAFAKLKTSTYSDQTRPGAPVSSNHFIRTISWNASGSFVATGAGDRTLRIWNPEKTNVKHSTELRTPGVPGTVALERVAFHPINENELASCSTDGMVRFWDVRSKASVGEVRVGEQPFTLAWTPDGTSIVAGRKDNVIVPIDRTAMKPVAEYAQNVQTNHTVFNWSGSHLFLTDGEGCVKIVRYPSFDMALKLNAHTSSAFAITMSPSGEYLAAGGGDALVSLWDTQEWICVRTLDITSGMVKSVDFSFDGSYITAGAEKADDQDDRKLHIAHVETGEIVHSIPIAQPAAQVSWHPFRYVLAYSADSQGLKIAWLPLGPLATNIPHKMDVHAPLNPSSLFSAQGLVVAITGGGSGYGLAIAAALHQNGAHKIYLLGRRLNVLQDAITTLEASPSAPKPASSVLSAISCDVTDQSSISYAVRQIKEEVGWVDVLINNAGVEGPKNGGDLYKAESIEQLRDTMLSGMDGTGWETTLKINTQAIIGVSGNFLPLLEAANIRRGWAPGKVTGNGNPRQQDTSALPKLSLDPNDDRLAQIITVASIASFMRHSAAGLAYNASKAAAAQLGKIMASFLSVWGIRSNIVAPGPYPSDMTKGNSGKYGTSEVPQGRMGSAEDVAGMFLFLVGRSGAYCNGVVQVTDGGRTGVWPSTY